MVCRCAYDRCSVFSYKAPADQSTATAKTKQYAGPGNAIWSKRRLHPLTSSISSAWSSLCTHCCRYLVEGVTDTDETDALPPLLWPVAAAGPRSLLAVTPLSLLAARMLAADVFTAFAPPLALPPERELWLTGAGGRTVVLLLALRAAAAASARASAPAGMAHRSLA